MRKRGELDTGGALAWESLYQRQEDTSACYYMYQRMMTMGVITRILINNGHFDYLSLGDLWIWSLCWLDQVFDVCHFVLVLSSYECGNNTKDRLK